MQANYLRMLANYYNKPPGNEAEAEEDVFEKSLTAESVFLQNEPSEMHEKYADKAVLDYNYNDKPETEEIRSNRFEYQRNSIASELNLIDTIDLDDQASFQDNNRRNAESSDFFFKNLNSSTNSRRPAYENDDERPIKGNSVSFEQMLEQELKKNNLSTPKAPQTPVAPRIKTAKIKKKKSLEDISVQNDSESIDLIEKNSNRTSEPTPKHEYLKKKSQTLFDSINFKKTPEDSLKKPNPAPKGNFLKRGQGRLCINQNPIPKSKISASISRTSYEDRSDTYNELQFSDKEDDKNLDLDQQIQLYANENQKLQKLIKEVEDKKRVLDRDKKEFFKEREKVLKDFEKWKDDELEKIKKEKAAYDKKLRVSTRDKEEIIELKNKVKELEQMLIQKDRVYEETVNRLEKELEAFKNPLKTPQEKFSESEEFKDSDDLQDFENLEEYEQSFNNPKEKETENESSEDLYTEQTDYLDKTLEKRSGKKEIVYSNGIKKEIYPDGYYIVYFNNKDIKQCFPDGRIIYHFADADTTQTTFPDGLQLFKFSNGQIEKHFPDGSKEISFQDGTVKCIYPDGQEESVFPDGTVQTLDSKGIKYIEFVNGQKDTIYPNGTKIRKFPDGRIRKIMPDGKVIEQ